VLNPDTIAITGAILLMLISKIDIAEFIKRIDFELLLYIFGIFLITGSLEYSGVINSVGTWLDGISPADVYWKFVLILWASAFLSASVDNIPITQVLLPVTKIMAQGYTPSQQHFLYFGLTYGVNWGDNLSPMGDNILVMNVAEKK
jgi:Na+/H+ antiporter NhaD/arsenite permease-like protein